MHESQKREFRDELQAVMDLYDKDKLTKAVLRHWWTALIEYPLQTVIHCIDQHVKASKFAPKPSDIIEQINAQDGRPTAEEAWSVALKASDESETIVWTDEIAGALACGAGDLLAEGDKTAARMAFRDSYNRLLGESRAKKLKLNCWVSLGHSVDKRNSVIEDAAERGLISRDKANTLLLEGTTKQGEQFKRLTGSVMAETNAEARSANIERMRAMVNGL